MNVAVYPDAETKLTDMERFDFHQLLNLVQLFGKDIPECAVLAKPDMSSATVGDEFGRAGLGIALHFRHTQASGQVWECPIVLAPSVLTRDPQGVMDHVCERVRRLVSEVST